MRTASLSQMQYWYGCYKRSNLTDIIGPYSYCAYRSCTCEKLGAWNRLSRFIDGLKVITTPTSYSFTAAGFVEREGVKFFRVETRLNSYEIEADKLC